MLLNPFSVTVITVKHNVTVTAPRHGDRLRSVGRDLCILTTEPDMELSGP